jgi:mono/diheme cytochrome c family protein
LEGGALAGACAAYDADPSDPKKRLLCGKAMFFFESFGTSGMPKPLIKWLLQSFPADLGPAFSNFGLIPDPSSADGLPLGMAKGANFGSVESIAFTCASCHFGTLPDGRYAVGAANHELDYGRMNLTFVMLPSSAMPGWSPAAHDPEALQKVEPMLSQLTNSFQLKLSLLAAMAPLLSGGALSMPSFSKESEGYYASWPPGTMDFFIEPLPFDDSVHTVSKVRPLWGLPDDAELASEQIPSAMLGSTGGTLTLANFLHSFVELGGGAPAEWPPERLAPLRDYILSLRAPAPLELPSSADFVAGRDVYASACLDCHGGPRGMGSQIYSFEEVGTDAAMQWWADGPDHDGQPWGDIVFPPGDSITHGIKSPRLVGLWTMGGFLHNGAVTTLEQLLCLAPRANISEDALGDAGHTYGCDLPESERAALLAYLRSH